MNIRVRIVFVSCVVSIWLYWPVAYADSIVVNGKRYDNIYLGVGTQVYYIQDPADGSMVAIPKSVVSDKDIQITPDREARRKLRDQWRIRRMDKAIETSTTTPESKPAISPKNTPKPVATEQEPKPVEKRIVVSGFGLDDKKRDNGQYVGIGPRGGLSSRKIFMDSNGVPFLTNTPEEFTGRPEYVEVTLHYEQIDVPNEFRAAPQSNRYYMIVLDNGLTVAADHVQLEGDRYVYTFKGRTGYFSRNSVVRIIEPNANPAADSSKTPNVVNTGKPELNYPKENSESAKSSLVVVKGFKRGMHLYFHAKIKIADGSELKYDLMLDTGASVSTIPLSLYSAGGSRSVASLDSQEFNTANGTTVSAYMTTGTVSLGSLSSKTEIALVNADVGLLGINFFDGKVFAVDLDNECILVDPN